MPLTHIGQKEIAMNLLKTIAFVSMLTTISIMSFSVSAGFDGDTNVKLTSAKLFDKIAQGGYVIYFRHAATDKVGEKTVPKDKLSDCSSQRNLSTKGRQQAKNINIAVLKKKIPIGQVFSSPYCRCVDTAQLAFGKVEKSDALHFAIHLPKSERGTISGELRVMMGTSPDKNTNTVIVSHTGNLKHAVGIWPKSEGDAHIFKPETNGNFSYLGYIGIDDWSM